MPPPEYQSAAALRMRAIRARELAAYFEHDEAWERLQAWRTIYLFAEKGIRARALHKFDSEISTLHRTIDSRGGPTRLFSFEHFEAVGLLCMRLGAGHSGATLEACIL
jgi:hypothetical protein